MILFTTPKCIFSKDAHLEDTNYKIYNLSSLKDSYDNLFNLIPPFKVSDYRDEKEFDIMYANYIINNDNAFIDLMKIIYDEYDSGNIDPICILVERDEIRDCLTESLIKFIQQRYGINSYLINTVEDLEYTEPSSFDITGLYNLDQDKERFVLLTTAIEG